MVDAAVTAKYTYAVANRTTVEDGPWASGIVTTVLNTAGLGRPVKLLLFGGLLAFVMSVCVTLNYVSAKDAQELATRCLQENGFESEKYDLISQLRVNGSSFSLPRVPQHRVALTQ